MNSPLRDVEAQVAHRLHRAEALADAGQAQLSHGAAPWRRRAGAVVARGAQRAAAAPGRTARPRARRTPGRRGRRAAAGTCDADLGAQGRALRGAAGDDLAGAEVLGAQHLGAQRRVVVEAHVLGAHAEQQRARRARPRAAPARRRVAPPIRTCARAGGVAAVEGQEVHRRRADEVGDEHARRPVVHLLRRAELLDHALVHDRDRVGHRHRLHLVVRDVDRGRLQPVVQRAQLLAHQLAELGVERAERLVHHEGERLAHDRAAERDALAVAARQARDRLVEQVRDAQDARRLVDLARRSRARGMPCETSGKAMLRRTFMCG